MTTYLDAAHGLEIFDVDGVLIDDAPWPGGGSPGADGKTVLNGTVNPGAGVGVNGDFYINTNTWTIFGPKAAGVWPAGTSMVGPQGIDGDPGPEGDPGVVQTVVAGTGITVNSADPANPIVTSSITQYTNENAQDAVGGILTDSTTIDFTYDDAANTITAIVKDASITAAKVAADVATQAELDAVSAAIPTTEAIQDIVGAMATDSSRIDFTYNDGAGTLTADILDGSVTAAKVAADVATQAELDAVSAAIPSTEAIQDVVGGMHVDSASIDFTYDDTANTITGAVITEAIQDIVGGMVVDSGTLDFTYDDTANTLTGVIKPASVTNAMLAVQPLGKVLGDGQADVQVVNSASIGDVFRFTLPTDLVAGDTVIAECYGNLLNNSGSSELPVYTTGIGSTTISGSPTSVTSNANNRAWLYRMVLTVVSPTVQRIHTTLTQTASGFGSSAWGTLGNTANHFMKTWDATEDLTVAKDIYLRVTFTVANANLSMTGRAFTVVKIGNV